MQQELQTPQNHLEDVEKDLLELSKKHCGQAAFEAANGSHEVAEGAKKADGIAEAIIANKPILYHVPYYCSQRVVHLIHEAGIQDKITVTTMTDPAQIKTPEFLKLNQLGKVPVLDVHDGSPLLESGAITFYLAEKYLPAESPLFGTPEQRGKLLQWCFYATSTFYPSLTGGFHPDEDRKAEAKTMTLKICDFIESELGDKTWLLGDNFTLADIFIAYELYGAQHLGWLSPEKHGRLNAYLERCFKRPAWIAAYPSPDVDHV